ncbi:MAG: ABC transporter substrate-binding protein [Candidatus Eisenbacteria bacterium]
MIRNVRVLSTVLLGLLLLTSTCARDAGEVTLMIGGAPAELDYWEEIASEFTQETGIAVDIMRQPTDTDQRRQSLLVPLKAGEDDPDVFLMDIIWIGQFAASGWLEPLDGRMTRDGLDADLFFGGIVEFADRFEGETVALPVYIDAGLLYYRTDLLEKYGYNAPPETWEDLVEISTAIQTGERKANPDFWGFVWQGAQYEGLICNFLEFALSNGGSLIDHDGRLTLERAENVEALTFMRDLITTYAVSPPNTYTEMKEEEVRSLFESGNAVFERNWPYAWGLHQAEGSNVRGKVGIALLPRFEGGRHVAALGGWHVGISRSSNIKDSAWELVKFIVSKKSQLGFALELGWNPARQDVYNTEDIARNVPHLVSLKKVFETASARPNLPYYSLLSRALQQKANAALSGIMSPEEALMEAQKEGLDIVATYGE